jgi:hypothetical protein
MSEAPELPELSWIPPEKNPWKIPLLDVRPITQGMISTSQDPEAARNAVSYGGDDGTGFIGQEPQVPRSMPSRLRYRRDRLLADGVLFTPACMEHKWAIFHHDGEILLVRSWQRKVYVAAQVEQEGDEIRIEAIHGTLTGDPGEPPRFTERSFDFILRSHALNLVHPAPLPLDIGSDLRQAGLFCFSFFGSLAHVAAVEEPPQEVPEPPLRSVSLLHIAVARGDAAGALAAIGGGIPVDLPSQDGLPPLHWALARETTDMLDFLLARGTAIDVRSTEGATALLTESQAEKPRHVAWLLERGADPNARDRRGFTALHRAAERGHREVVDLLLAKGADPRVEAEGHTPRSLAEGRGHAEIVRRLSPTA